MELGDIVYDKLEVNHITTVMLADVLDTVITHKKDFSGFTKTILDISYLLPNIKELISMLKIPGEYGADDIISTSIIIEILFNVASGLDDEVDDEAIMYEIESMFIDSLMTYGNFDTNRLDSNPAVYEAYTLLIRDMVNSLKVIIDSLAFNEHTEYIFIGKKVINYDKMRFIVNINII